MIIIAVFVSLIFLYSLMSQRLEHTILTGPILFTSAGLLLIFTLPVTGELEADRKAFQLLAEIGLVLTLFSDATRINLAALRANEKLPMRLLSTGMFLTILLGVVAGMLVLPQLSFWEIAILSAILAPTDAGLGEVIVNSPLVPGRIRQALSVEAGLNDGLSVPFLMFFIDMAGVESKGTASVLFRFLFEQLGLGVAVGIAIGFAGGWLLEVARRRGWMAKPFQNLGLVALPILCIMGSEPLGASMFIAAYVAGLAVQVKFEQAGEHSVEFTEGWGRLLDLFVFFLFGMLTARAIGQFNIALIVYAALSLTVVRMLPVAVSMIGSGIDTSSRLFMGWFGPRGLASIVLGLVYLEQESHLPGEQTIALAVMATVLLSIFAHGFTSLPGIGLYSRKMALLEKS